MNGQMFHAFPRFAIYTKSDGQLISDLLKYVKVTWKVEVGMFQHIGRSFLEYRIAEFRLWGIVVVKWRRIIIKGLLLYCRTSRRVMQVKK